MNVYGASHKCMNVYRASNICMNIYGTHYSISWISSSALHQKLRIEQTSTVGQNEALGMGLDPKTKARNPI